MSVEQTEELGVEIAKALRYVFVSPNESDRNYEPANVVDGLYMIGRGLHRIATALEVQAQNEEADR